MKIYVLVHRQNDDYSSLEGKHEFIFESVPATSSPDVQKYLNRLKYILDQAFINDRIVLNGPTWLVALAGYIWLTHEFRDTMQMLIFDSVTHKYVDFNPEFTC